MAKTLHAACVAVVPQWRDAKSQAHSLLGAWALPICEMTPSKPRLLVACFCAAWCRTCDAYVAVMDSLKARYADQADFVWVDIEDQADVLDDVDVENFPTVLISNPTQVFFWGTLLPHESTATQLIDRVLSGDMRPSDAADIAQLDARLRNF